MTKNRKVLFTIIMIAVVILIMGLILVIINAFTGNPFSKSIAKDKVQRYIHDVYSPESIVEKSYYSAKDGYYIVEAKIKNEKTNFKYSSNLIIDEKVAEHYQKRFNNDYIKACQDLMDNDNTYLEFPRDIFIYTSVIVDDNYNSDFNKLNVQQKIYLMGIKNYDKTISDNDSKSMASKIASQLLNKLGDQYNFKSIQMSYLDRFGVYEIVINNRELTIDELSKNTKKLDNNDIGEEEKAFIERFNR
jgi:hypothetical protein